MNRMSLKGEVGFTAGDMAYTLAFTINALCVLEDRLGVGVAEIGAQMGQSMRISTLRTVFWAGLIAHHDLTEEQAGDIITLVGTAETAQLIAKAFSSAFPEAAKGTARPQKAAAGTGTPS